mgnify:CR=1 FL=1
MRQESSPVIIEFAGVPGGGKTTSARSFVARRSDSSVLITLDMRARLPEAAAALSFALAHPRAFFALSRFTFVHSAPELRRFSLHLAFRACGKYAKAVRVHALEAVIDEGLIHVLMTLPAAPVREDTFRRILARLPLPAKAYIAREGNFHRFAENRDVPHPRLRATGLTEWKEAVRANVGIVARLLPEFGVRVEDIAGQSGVELRR